MTQRTPPQHKTDDNRFPVRVKFVVPERGLRSISDGFGDRCRDWLARELGPGGGTTGAGSQWAWHSGGRNARGQVSAVYFRTPAAAQRFVEAFPEFELADGVGG
jgi:hypothetical protein